MTILLRKLTDADYWWSHRILGYASNGSVAYSASVEQCENPPTSADLGAIESAHERALAHPGVQTVSTIGPFRKVRKDADS